MGETENKDEQKVAKKRGRKPKAEVMAELRLKVEVAIENLKGTACELEEEVVAIEEHDPVIEALLENTVNLREIRAMILQLPEGEQKPWLMLADSATDSLDRVRAVVAERADLGAEKSGESGENSE